MKKGKQLLGLIILLIGSFYFTNHTITTMREEDPIMKEIEKRKEKFEIEPVNAVIQKESITPGLYGQEIDYEKSYNQMKKYGSYTEALTVLKNTKPEISSEDTYDFYIQRGNEEKREVSLIFTIEDKSLERIITILNEEKVQGTFFIDGNILNEYVSIIRKNTSHEYELLSFQGSKDSSFLKAASSYLHSITGIKGKYCFIEEENKAYERFCRKEKLHKIKPTISIKNNLYKTIKETLDNGIIYSIEWNEDTEKELSSTIQYIKSKAYKTTTLKILLKEQVERE